LIDRLHRSGLPPSPRQKDFADSLFHRCSGGPIHFNGGRSVKDALRPGLLSFIKVATHHTWDWVGPMALLALATLGVCFIYSAQLATGLSQWKMQIGWLLAGGLVYTAVALVDYEFWLKYAHWVYLISMILLVVVLMPGIGTERYGAQRWIDFGPFSFQPSELAKLATLLMCSSILARNKIGSVKPSFLTLGKLALAVAIPMILILAQPNLGTALVIPPMVVSLLYVAKLPRQFFITAIVLFALLGTVVTVDMVRYYNFMTENNLPFQRDWDKYQSHSWLPILHGYQRNRILATVDPERIDPKGIGWNLIQSRISVGSGGLAGKGWTQGTQAQLGYLPSTVSHNDFIFSVLAEEKGFLGSLTVLSLFGVMLMNGVRIAGQSRDRFGTYIALGVSMIIAMHVFVNIGMTIGMMPITGLPLPFLSYGGSFVLSCCLLQGLVQSVYRFRKNF
jgi:rod shape determining protein RodA